MIDCELILIHSIFSINQSIIQSISLFPASVAELLKEEEFGDNVSTNDRTLIAEAYKDVTVLFADIVGFTKMSSGIKPSELVCIKYRNRYR